MQGSRKSLFVSTQVCHQPSQSDLLRQLDQLDSSRLAGSEVKIEGPDGVGGQRLVDVQASAHLHQPAVVEAENPR
jgi:hypothetical protein